jgi:hypothetical protein
VPRATEADYTLDQPKLNRPRDTAFNDVLDTANKIIARQKTWSEKIKEEGTGLSLQTMLIDRFAGFEKISKLMEPLKGIQMMYYLRMYDQRMNFVSQTAANGALQLVEKKRADGKSEYVIESKEGASLKNVSKILSEATPLLGSGDNSSRVFTLYLAALRANAWAWIS